MDTTYLRILNKRKETEVDARLCYVIWMINLSDRHRSYSAVGAVVRRYYRGMPEFARLLIRQLLSEKRPAMLKNAKRFLDDEDIMTYDGSKSKTVEHRALDAVTADTL